jgi:hypothetical protein
MEGELRRGILAVRLYHIEVEAMESILLPLSVPVHPEEGHHIPLVVWVL